jgi:hypothetical protein
MNLKSLVAAGVCLTLAILFANHSYKSAASSDYATQYNQESGAGPVRNLRFTLFDAGIRTNQISIKPGLVNILIEDKTNIAEGVTLRRIVGAAKEEVGKIQKAIDQPRGRSLFRLTPGEYELFDPSQPANKAVIMVAP